MRRLELVEGKSSKFWEVEREGASVTTRWGRLGTTGKSKTKSFADTAAAQRAIDAQVRSKLVKGYAEITASVADSEETLDALPRRDPHAPEPTLDPALDEDALVIPRAWLKRVRPRRGGRVAGAPPRMSGAKGWAGVLDRFASRAPAWFAGAKVGLPIQAAAIDWLTTERSTVEVPGDVEVAAVIVRMLCEPASWDDRPPHRAVIAWLVRAGSLEYAVRATLGSYGYLLQSFQVHQGPAEGWDFRRRQPRAALGPLALLRSALACADDDAYGVARDAAGEMREAACPEARCATAFLFPTETAWCADERAQASVEGAPLLIDAVSDPVLGRELARRLGARRLIGGAYEGEGHLPTLLDALGAAIEPIVDDALSAPYLEAAQRRSLVECLAILPSDSAVLTLVENVEAKYFLPGLIEAMDRFPRRAVRLIAPRLLTSGKTRDRARSLMAALLRKAPEAAALERVTLPADVDAAVEALGTAETVAEAAPENVPPVLASPPWSRSSKRPNPKTVKDVAPLPVEPTMDWAPGERERWAGPPSPFRYGYDSYGESQHEAFVGRLASDEEPLHHAYAYLREADEAWAHRALAVWRPPPEYLQLQPIAARCELHALPLVARCAEWSAGTALSSFGPYRAPSLAIYVAETLLLKSARSEAVAWLERHAEVAVVGLVPHAVGAHHKRRHAAEEALGYLVRMGHRALVAEVAGRFGDAVSEAIAPLLDLDPLEAYPAKLPVLPSFWDAAALPRLCLRGDRGALPASAMEAVGVMLAFSSPDAPYVGVERLVEACTPESLGAFAWGLFEAWLAAGTPPKESWALTSMSWLGNDECARRLAPMLRRWPGESAHARAVLGLGVLAGIGTDVALMHLHGIAQRLKFKGLKQAAGQKIAQIAEARGLSEAQLADRLVPDLGLDERGSMRLDFGPRAFTVGFDENLRPFVRDAAGVRLERLPKPGRKDDSALAAQASATWKALVKDARTVARQQLVRVESAMCTQRRWSAQELDIFFTRHPLVVHVARRLIWGVYENGVLTRTFRVVEDSSYADPNDDPVALHGETIGIPHPLELDDALTADWAQVFADYEIIQPFRQLGRPVHRRSEADAASHRLDRVKGRAVDPNRLLGLESQGWERGAVEGGGAWHWVERTLGDGVRAILAFEPGLVVGEPHQLGDQTLGSLTLVKTAVGRGYGADEQSLAFGDISEVAFSELAEDLDSILR
ncbi:MAG: DUF4132 domain-containing protein [Sandaracinaceae bacterium]|nr:DUF4132 domain-containing protein [Sandaracinaceae bacterium]